MKLERRHFEFIAATLAQARPELEEERDTDEFGDDPWKVGFDSGIMSAWVDIVDDFALACRDYNENFDVVRFRRACGVRNV
jgi:hypothetical protein